MTTTTPPPTLVREMGFYGAYHTDSKNKSIHAICVPAIFFSAMMFVAWATAGRRAASDSDPKARRWYANASTPIALAYCAYYISLDPLVGLLAAGFYLALWAQANYVVHLELAGSLARGTVLKWAVVIQLLSWWAQVSIGHAIYEGRKPALLDSLVQAFSLAPLFVVYETLWAFFPGFQVGLQGEVHNEIARNLVTLAKASYGQM